MPATFPSDWREAKCVVVTVPFPLVPYVTGMLKMLENRGFWASDEDYLSGYTATYELERCFVSTCLDVLLESNNRLYRLLDNALYGSEYTVESTDPLVVTPDPPAVRQLSDALSGSLLDNSVDLRQLLQNALNGEVTDRYTTLPGIRDQLQNILDAIASGDTDMATILSDLTTIIGALA